MYLIPASFLQRLHVPLYRFLRMCFEMAYHVPPPYMDYEELIYIWLIYMQPWDTSCLIEPAKPTLHVSTGGALASVQSSVSSYFSPSKGEDKKADNKAPTAK